MTNAYQISDLVARLKDKGLVVAEDAAKILLTETFAWVEESAVLSANKYDDVAALALPQLEKFIMPYLDKIDGK